MSYFAPPESRKGGFETHVSAPFARRHVAAVATGGRKRRPDARDVLAKAVTSLNAERGPEAVSTANILPIMRQVCERHRIRHVARVARIDDANLGRIITGKWKASAAMIAALSAAIGRLQAVGAAPVADMA